MKRFTRRSFLASSVATLASPAIAAPAGVDTEVIIIGAGAAGIAAARRLSVANRRFVMLEAADRIGGRCVTDTNMFGVPVDLGARWIYTPETNPLIKLGPKTGFDFGQIATRLHLRVGRREARDSELEEFLGMRVRARHAVEDASRAKTDTSAVAALPRELRDWRATMEFLLGAYGCGKDLSEVSVYDYAKIIDRDRNTFCRQGYGALLAKLGAVVPARLSTPVTRIEWHDRVVVETEKGRLVAASAIITPSTNVLSSGGIKFVPELPKRQLDALASLGLGSCDHVVLEFDGKPLGTAPDDLIFEKADGKRTAALLANVAGTSLAMVDVGGSFGRELSGAGGQAMVDFAVEWIGGLFGSDLKKAVKRTHATRWSENPYVRGAFAGASPGKQGARKILMEPLQGKIYFAGEAVHETNWGSVGGAWESGSRAAEAILRKLGVLKEPEEPRASQPPKSPPKPNPPRKRT
jgi:monoamine oxidase